MASLRLPSPLIKLDVRVSRIQLSDRFHREAHDVAFVARGACAASSNIFASRHSPFRQVPLFGCLQAKGQSPQHLRRHERIRSQGPFLRRRYPASSVIRPCPTPADIAIQDSVEAATLMPNGSPPITRITFPACRAHYPGGSNGCVCRLLPHPCCLPRFAGGSASASLLSGPAQAIAVDTVFKRNRKRSPTTRTRAVLIADMMMLERKAALKPAR